MKNNFLIALTIFVSLLSSNTFARDILAKATIKVYGNCDMCKEQIETAAKINGVKYAEWNQETQILTVVYAPEKNSLDKIQQSIADAGYDTEKFKASEEAYKNLPKCCQYEK